MYCLCPETFQFLSTKTSQGKLVSALADVPLAGGPVFCLADICHVGFRNKTDLQVSFLDRLD